jgi:hypothetical protein
VNRFLCWSFLQGEVERRRCCGRWIGKEKEGALVVVAWSREERG